jgi:uncharacterized membrane protein YccC
MIHDCPPTNMVLEFGIRTVEVAMMRNKNLAIGLLVVGLAILLGSALADIVGLGGSPFVFGYKQLAGSAVGAVLSIAGVVFYWRAGRAD